MSGQINGVVEQDGEPISGAVVKAVSHDGSEVRYTETESDGTYSMWVPEGEYHVVTRYQDGHEIFSDIGKPWLFVESAIPDSVVDNLDVWYPGDEGSGITLSDALETVDATLDSDSWQDNEEYYRGSAPYFDGIDDRYVSDQSVDIDSVYNGKVSFCGWVEIDDTSNHPSFGFVNGVDAYNDPGVLAYLDLDNDHFVVAVGSGGGRTGGAMVNQTPQTDHLYFIGVVVDGLNTSLYVWDSAQQIGADENVSVDEDWRDNNMDLVGAGEWDGNYLSGVVPAVGYSLGGVLTELNFESIWEDTRP